MTMPPVSLLRSGSRSPSPDSRPQSPVSRPLAFSPSLPLAFFLTLLALAAAPCAHAYVTFRSTWPSGDIPLRLQLDSTAATRIFPLTDGSTSWNVVAQAALDDWNVHLGRSRFTSTLSTATFSARQEFDGLNQVSFSTNTYGLAFSPFELAATLLDNSDGLGDTVRSREADVIVNKSIVWNSYRGPTLNFPTDLRRVLLHEFGHVLGLTHPDLATPRQNVASALNSFITDIETLQPDDIAGSHHICRNKKLGTSESKMECASGGFGIGRCGSQGHIQEIQIIFLLTSQRLAISQSRTDPRPHVAQDVVHRVSEGLDRDVHVFD